VLKEFFLASLNPLLKAMWVEMTKLLELIKNYAGLDKNTKSRFFTWKTFVLFFVNWKRKKSIERFFFLTE
jgi:hypothetical protein